MGRYEITPLPSEWKDQNERFLIKCYAWDDNDVQVTSRKIELRLYVNGSITRVYGDDEGLCWYSVYNTCTLTAYLIYTNDVYDEYAGTTKIKLCEDLYINFNPFITSVTAVYNGPSVRIDSLFNIKYVSGNAIWSDGNLTKISYESFSCDDYVIHYLGDNIKHVYYTDNKGVEYDVEIHIEGDYKITNVHVDYIGNVKWEEEKVLKSEIKVTVTKTDNITEFDTILQEDEWDFSTLPFPNRRNEGIIYIKVENKDYPVTIPFELYDDSKYYIKAWYEGPDIEVDNMYDLDSVVVRLFYPNGNFRRVDTYQLNVESLFVTKEGWNWFKVTYKPAANIALTEWFCVYGYIAKIHQEYDFKVIYEETNEDLTDYFYDKCKVDQNHYKKSTVLVKWEDIRQVAVDHKWYGNFIITIPPFSGHGGHTATLWRATVESDDITSIRVMLIRNLEEEKDNGNKKEDSRCKPRNCYTGEQH